jgi:hypothetical protein
MVVHVSKTERSALSRMVRPVVLSLLFHVTACSQNTDLDRLCGFYDQLLTHPESATLSDDQRIEAIRKQVTTELDMSSVARQVWHASVKAGESGRRYGLFKSAVESDLRKPFNCPSMQRQF